MTGHAEIKQAAEILRGGGLVAMPTETVYGLAASVFNPRAVARVFEVKQRPSFDPLIAHIALPEDLDRVASDIPDAARKLMDVFWPGPLTLILPKRGEIPDIVTSGLATVAVRMPDHPMARELILESGLPLAAPSANLFGRISPTTAEHVREQLGNGVDMILDGGPCRVGVESTIIGWRDGVPTLLRAGGLPLEDAERVIGKIFCPPPGPPVSKPDSPGQLMRHYSPRTRTVLDADALPEPGAKAGWLGINPPAHPDRFSVAEILSESGDLREAASNLFAAMHRLDEDGLDVIIAEPAPDEGLGRAINDRLKRASARSF